MDSFVICVRNRDSGNNEFGGETGPISYLRVPENETIPRPSHKMGGVKQWMDSITSEAFPSPVNGTSGLDIVFFVHGYNTSPQEALTRQRLVQRELKSRGMECMVVGFDWPTGGSVALYEYDRYQAQVAAALLVKGGILPFATYTLPNCPINIHLMAHSMGAFVVREAFRSVDKIRDANLPNDWRIGQMVLFAADISSDCFEANNADMTSVFSHCGRLTNYFSGYDLALAASNLKNIDVSSRVGRVGMPVDTPADNKAVDVDCGPRYAAIPEIERKQFKVINGMVSHSWYLEDVIWYDDLAYALSGKIDRNSIPTRILKSKNDFTLIDELAR